MKQASSKMVGFQKFLCTAAEGLDPPRKLPLLLGTDTKDPLEVFFDIVAFGVNDILWLSKPPP